MTNKVLKSDFNIKNDKDSENKETEYSNITNNISDRGDSGKETGKPDGLDNKDSINKENEQRKSIDVFIKQYLPDRGDSKRLLNKTNRITNNLNFKNKNRAAVVDSDTEKNTNKIDETESDGDILVIPETGEKVCKTDIKLSYTKPTTATVKGNETLSQRPDFKCKINHIYDNRIRCYNRHVFQRKDKIRLNDPSPISTGDDTSFNEKFLKSNNDSEINYNNKNQGPVIERNIDERAPLKVTSKFIDQILKQAGISADFRERNELLHSRAQATVNKEKKLTNNPLKQFNNHAKNFERKENQTIFSVAEYTKVPNKNKLDQLTRRAKDQLDAQKDGSRKITQSEKERIQIDPNKRKKIRTRYNMKLKNNDDKDEEYYASIKNKTVKNDKLVKTSSEDESKQNISSADSSKSANVKKSEIEGKRKPIIKTITTKDDAKVYKAVTFVDDKHTTPLQVKIPEIKRRTSKIINESMKARVKNVVSKVSLKEKNVNRRDSRKRKQNKHVKSSEASIGKVSPPTEVAKWAPSCINEHTKPYYEAWVNTTLAAIARDSGDELLLERQQIIECFKRALEDTPKTPEYEELLNEKYTGRIRVRQR